MRTTVIIVVATAALACSSSSEGPQTHAGVCVLQEDNCFNACDPGDAPDGAPCELDSDCGCGSYCQVDFGFECPDAPPSACPNACAGGFGVAGESCSAPGDCQCGLFCRDGSCAPYQGEHAGCDCPGPGSDRAVCVPHGGDCTCTQSYVELATVTIDAGEVGPNLALLGGLLIGDSARERPEAWPPLAVAAVRLADGCASEPDAAALASLDLRGDVPALLQLGTGCDEALPEAGAAAPALADAIGERFGPAGPQKGISLGVVASDLPVVAQALDAVMPGVALAGPDRLIDGVADVGSVTEYLDALAEAQEIGRLAAVSFRSHAQPEEVGEIARALREYVATRGWDLEVWCTGYGPGDEPEPMEAALWMTRTRMSLQGLVNLAIFEWDAPIVGAPEAQGRPARVAWLAWTLLDGQPGLGLTSERVQGVAVLTDGMISALLALPEDVPALRIELNGDAAYEGQRTVGWSFILPGTDQFFFNRQSSFSAGEAVTLQALSQQGLYFVRIEPGDR